MIKRYRHYIGIKLESGMFRALNSAVYERAKISTRYNVTDFIRDAIFEKLERQKIENLLKTNKN